jgi:hypothetical protein
VEFACCWVGCDGDLMVAQLSRAALRLCRGQLPARAASRCVYMAWRTAPTRRGGGVHAPGSRHVVRLVPWSGAETARARWRLVVRGGDLSCEAETCRRGFL